MLLNKSVLSRFSALPSNYNFDEVMPYVPTTEKIWLLEILGQPFYDELNEQVATNTLTDENATLCVDALWPYLAVATTYEALPFIWSHVSQIGITIGHSENASSVSLKDMTYIESHLRRQVEVLKDFLIDYLNNHCDSFPLFQHSCECKCGQRAQLKQPNADYKIWSTPRICVDLK